MKGFREGKGELRMKDGSLFSSYWKQGVREGEGERERGATEQGSSSSLSEIEINVFR